MVFSAVLATTHEGPGYEIGQFLIGISAGVVGGVIGIAVLWFLLRKLRLGEVLGTTSQLAAVIGVAAACDIVRDDAGLVAAVTMGLAVANMHGFDAPARRPFFETLVQLIIGVLFISISATVTPQSLRHLILVRADGKLMPVTRASTPVPQPGDTMVLLEPALVGS